MNIDEFLMNSNEDDVYNFSEESMYVRIMEQITNMHGDFTGTTNGCNDFILEYFVARFGEGEEVIRNFEAYCSENGLENMYDEIAKYMVELYEMVGIRLDLDREILSFSDIYDVYIVFVLMLKDTIISSYKTYLMNNGIVTYTNAYLNDYLFSDEFCVNDNFLQNAMLSNPEVAVTNVSNLVDDNVITLDQDVFVQWLYKFVNDTRLNIDEGGNGTKA